jgi:uncharacterized protein YkwD
MNRASKSLPAALVALAILSLGCTMPLPTADLTATAESQPAPLDVRSGSGGVQVASTGPLTLSAHDDDEDLDAVADVDDESTPSPAATPTPVAAVSAATPEVVSQPENYASDLLAAVNAARTQAGAPELTPNAALNAAAIAYARYMGQTNSFGHIGTDGSTPQSRIAAAGFVGIYKGETLTAGQGSPGTALSAFMNSSAHAKILLEASARAIGVGYFYAPGSTYKHYWVVITANP